MASPMSSKCRRRKLASMLETHGNVCWICEFEIDLDLPRDHPEAATMDHVLPISRGGNHHMSNLRPAHRCCNESRRNPQVEAA